MRGSRKYSFVIIVGITAYTQRGHIARATLEATCFQTKAILEAMEKDSGKALAKLAVDGGMTNSDLTMQVRCLSPPLGT
jgi:glycerol kinase